MLASLVSAMIIAVTVQDVEILHFLKTVKYGGGDEGNLSDFFRLNGFGDLARVEAAQQAEGSADGENFKHSSQTAYVEEGSVVQIYIVTVAVFAVHKKAYNSDKCTLLSVGGGFGEAGCTAGEDVENNIVFSNAFGE